MDLITEIKGDLQSLLRKIERAERTTTVSTSDQLMVALQNALPGGTIVLAPNVYTGHFALGNVNAEAVTIVGGPGVRVQSPDTAASIRTRPGARGYALVNLDVAPVHGGYASIAIGDALETLDEHYPSHITLDGVTVMADETERQIRGVQAIGKHITIRNSDITGIKAFGADSQGIWANGPGPYLIEHNHIEAAGENIMFGGADTKVSGMTPADVVIRYNTLIKPLAWRDYNTAQPTSATRYVVKNLLELKHARRVHIHDNVLRNCWAAGQTGYGVLFTPRNQNGSNPWTVVEDVIFERNEMSGVAGCVSILGTDNLKPSQTTKGITIRGNYFHDYGAAYGVGTYAFLLGAGAEGVVIDHNTLLSAKARGIVSAYGEPMVGFQFTNNLTPHDTYGILGSGVGTGNPALAHYFPGAVVTGNVIAGGVARVYPAGNQFPPLADFLGQFNPDGSLVDGSPYVGLGK